ncbi:MAG: slipin family protein [Candidatus Dojkabacteria bacterium]|jgi:regulator of protease activity HflC (stomatin/prohibitin superfamily)|nr:slipin family protein [Candidatus Dojkabacteria bacterium]
MDGLSSGLVACLVPFGIGAGFLLLLILSSIKQINQYERGILFEMGRYKTIVDPGWRIVIPILQSMVIVDVRTKTVDLQNQETMTKDNVSIQIGVVLYYRIAEAMKSVLNVEDSRFATSQLAETTMRSVVGEVDLNELLGHRDKVAQRIQQIIAQVVTEWGIEIQAVELKDVVLPSDMKRTMAKQAEAEREKISVVTKSEGEVQAAENLANAAKVISTAPGALHLRTLSAINDISSDQSNTIVFAIPLEILRAFERFGKSGLGTADAETENTKKTT